MTTLSLFIHPRVVPSLYAFIFPQNIKEKILNNHTAQAQK